MLNEMLAAKAKRLMPRIVCKSGLSLSVQANSSAYCEPREDQGPYTSVEVGFPNRKVEALMPYAEREDQPTETVYGFVPIELVENIIQENGGIDLNPKQPGGFEKYVKDGKVAVLISSNFGAGWYTWNKDFPEILFDKEIVAEILNGYNAQNIKDIVKSKYPYVYIGAIEQLSVEWVPVGDKFIVEEYDGSESLRLIKDTAWITA